ncbi:MAG: phosphoribosyl-ATP diphosphatase [Pseudomonadota bacterium]|nr:phosphoribosyl-ATP diphosphatase [Pseudomonadota bacterium]
MDNCQDSTAIVLDQLANVIKSRKNADPEISYTAQLLNDGISEIARKVGEEAVECVVSSFSNKKKELIDESADLLYHLLVLWTANEISPYEVWNEISRREGVSGILEKAGRVKG